MIPQWFGLCYPSEDDLLGVADAIQVPIVTSDMGCSCFLPEDAGGPLIILSADASPLERIWGLAHEVGHALLHFGPRPLARGHQECQANRWAACALIPQARIEAHGNASLDAFIGALSSHYEDIPLEDCPARRLAAKIAQIRLELLTPKFEEAV